jgi:type II secretory pathway pseudopilin PulG
MAILAILLIIVAYAVVHYFTLSRDAKRKADIESYRIALEEYFNDKGHYPPGTTLNDCGGNALVPYLPAILCDIDGTPYKYLVNLSGNKYWLYTTLINTNDEVIARRGCQNGCGPDNDGNGSGDYNYGVNYQQVVSGESPTPEEELASEPIAPTCTSGTGGPFCIAGSCGTCCPGGKMRCNPGGMACTFDDTCGFQGN